MAAQEMAPVSEGIVFQTNMPMSPFQRDIGSHQMRQRLSLDATSLVRQGSLESMTFERKQQVNRRWALAPLMRGAALQHLSCVWKPRNWQTTGCLGKSGAHSIPRLFVMMPVLRVRPAG